MEKSYRVEKYDSKMDKWIGYGSLPISDVKLVIKGYKRNESDLAMEFATDDFAGMYTRKGTATFYTVEEI